MPYTIRSLPPIDNDYKNIGDRENLVDSENNEEFSGDSHICIPPRNEIEEEKLFELWNGFCLYEICSLAHPSGFSNIKTDRQFHVINNLIGYWTLGGALGTGKQGTVISAKDVPYLWNNFRSNSFYMSARIDLQGFNTKKLNEDRFERYAIQMDNKNYATVHVKVGIEFGVHVIRRAFWNSVMAKTHIKLSELSKLPDKIPANFEAYRNWKKNIEEEFENIKTDF
jgi:hypothetical protein